MKFCSKCGNQMQDDMMFCQNCGTKFESEKPEEEVALNYSFQKADAQTSASQNKIRRGMKIGAIICFVLAGIYGLISFAVPVLFAMTLFMGILGAMYLVLGKTPKGSKYILGKNKGLTKGAFVAICILAAFVSVGIVASNSEAPASTTTTTGQVEEHRATTLDEVEAWYLDQMPAVSQDLIEYAKVVNGISNFNVTEGKFFFGEEYGWYDCNYTFYFTCKVNGEACFGEARAFRKYNEDDIHWFHFEIAKDSDWSVVVEQYDDSADQMMEEHYKELKAQYQ